MSKAAEVGEGIARKYHEDQIVKAVLDQVKRALNLAPEAWEAARRWAAEGKVEQEIAGLWGLFHVNGSGRGFGVPDGVVRDAIRLLLVPAKRGRKRCPVCGQDVPK